ncbi:pilus assembly protein PilM [Candidatus Roizmanbacteria bacterium]|nr:pilus assembly protein PilM [Candidatus Roizmanbacteria bacterium]
MSDTAVTIYLGENEIQVVEAKQEGKQIEILGLGFDDSGLPIYDVSGEKAVQDETKIIEKVYDSLKTKIKNVNVVIPDAYSFSQIVEMPKLKEKELLSAIKYQADQFIPMPLEETALDLEIIQEDPVTKKILVLIVACPQALVAKVESLVEMSGLVPDSIENELSACSRLIASFYKPGNQEGGTVFINLGFSFSSFYFYHHRLKLVVDTHTFKVGQSLFLKEVQANTNFDFKKSVDALRTVGLSKDASYNFEQIILPATNEFMKELEKYLLSLKEKYKVTVNQLFLFNKAIDLKYLDQRLGAHFSLPAGYYNLLPELKNSPLVAAYAAVMPRFITPIGASLR